MVIKNKIDLTSKDDLNAIFQAANRILQEYHTIDEINRLEEESAENETLLLYNAAIKIAKSKLLVNKIDKKLSITIVFAIYKEHHRILKKDAHPNGENFIENKIEQLNWLFEDVSDLVDWKMMIVDDGCPYDSGSIAESITKGKFKHYNIEVLFLEEAVKDHFPIAKNLTSTEDSNKGGSILYGMCKAAKENSGSNHIIIYTDADLSLHLSQIGLLVDDIVEGRTRVSICSKRDHNAVIVKSKKRNLRGLFFIYLWKRLIPDLSYLNDTQCPMKAFRADIVSEITEDNLESKFAFDMELLLKVQLSQSDKNVPYIKTQPVVMIDSETESTTKALNPYLTMLKSIAKMYKKYLPYNEKSEKLANFINHLDEKGWKKLVDNIPKENNERGVDGFSYDFLNHFQNNEI